MIFFFWKPNNFFVLGTHPGPKTAVSRVLCLGAEWFNMIFQDLQGQRSS